MKYKRILIKISGEALSGQREYGIEPKFLDNLGNQLKQVHEMGVQVAIVVGGGNIHRGVQGATRGMDRTTSDYMGMLATVINALALQDCMEKLGLYTRVMTAIDMQAVAESYIRRRAIRHLEKNRIVIFAAGTGNPYFTTDTTAALRANEIDADIILKATKVDGIYDKDPVKHSDATMFQQLNYIDVLNKNIQVMDYTAITLCMENKLDIIVFNLLESGQIPKIVSGEKVGTLVTG